MKRCVYHPERKAKARNLCQACYSADYIRRINAGEHVVSPHVPHPETCPCGEPAGTTGKCRRCYQREYKRHVRAGGKRLPQTSKSAYAQLLDRHLALRAEVMTLRELLWGTP